MNIGIDIGNTIVGNKALMDKYWIDPNCFKVIKRIVSEFDNVYLISRVNQDQRDRSLKWIKEVDLFNKTGISSNNLYYCWERKDKAIFARALNLNVFIDDRAEVMYNIDSEVIKLLINPPEQDLIEYKNKLINTEIVKSWEEIENSIF